MARSNRLAVELSLRRGATWSYLVWPDEDWSQAVVVQARTAQEAAGSWFETLTPEWTGRLVVVPLNGLSGWEISNDTGQPVMVSRFRESFRKMADK